MISPHVLSRAETRWRDLLARRPDLSDAVALQRQLVDRTSQLADLLLQHDAARDRLVPDAAADNVQQGVPAFVGAAWTAGIRAAAPALDDFCNLLAEGGAGDPAVHVRDALREGRIYPDTLVAASLARNRHAIACGAAQLGLAADLLWLIGELCAAPVAAVERDRLAVDGRIAEAVSRWKHGFCPFCGSWPAFAESARQHGQRTLRCSFCAAGWEAEGARCIHCGATEDLRIGLTDPAGSASNIEACDKCRHYLKSLDVDSPTPPLLVPVEDLVSVDLDEAAAEAGYTRPTVQDWNA